MVNEILYSQRAYMEITHSYSAEARNINWLIWFVTMLTTWMYTEPVFLRNPGKIKMRSPVSIGRSSVKVLNVMVEFILRFSNKNNCSSVRSSCRSHNTRPLAFIRIPSRSFHSSDSPFLDIINPLTPTSPLFVNARDFIQ